MNSPSHTLVLLDWNGTVMDDLDRAVSATNDAIAGHGIHRMERAAFQDSFTLPMKSWLRGMGIPDTATAEVEKRWNASMEAPAPAREKVAETLNLLRRRGVVTGVVTAASHAVLVRDISHNGLDGIFDQVRTSVRDKAACLASLRHLGTRAYYMGDTAYDMSSARDAGYSSISIGGGYQRPDTLAAAGADYHLDKFEELVSLLNLPGPDGSQQGIVGHAVPDSKP